MSDQENPKQDPTTTQENPTNEAPEHDPELDYTEEELLLIADKMSSFAPWQIKQTIMQMREQKAAGTYYNDYKDTQADFRADKMSKASATALKHLNIINGLKPGQNIPDETRKHMSRIKIKDVNTRSYEENALEKAYNLFLNTKVTEYSHKEETNYKTVEKTVSKHETDAAINQSLIAAVTGNFSSYRALTSDKDKAWKDLVDAYQKDLHFEGEKKGDLVARLFAMIDKLMAQNDSLNEAIHKERKRNGKFFKKFMEAKRDEQQALVMLEALKRKKENGEPIPDSIETMLVDLGKTWFEAKIREGAESAATAQAPKTEG